MIITIVLGKGKNFAFFAFALISKFAGMGKWAFAPFCKSLGMGIAGIPIPSLITTIHCFTCCTYPNKTCTCFRETKFIVQMSLKKRFLSPEITIVKLMVFFSRIQNLFLMIITIIKLAAASQNLNLFYSKSSYCAWTMVLVTNASGISYV